MPDLRSCVVWSVVFGLVSYVAYFQLQETMVTFTEFVIVPAKRREVSKQFLERPEAMADFHPYSSGVSNVQRKMSEEDAQKIRELRYIRYEKIPLGFGLPGELIKFGVDERLDFVEPDVRVKLSVSMSKGELPVSLRKFFKVNGTFLLADYKSKKESGTVLIDSRSFTGPRILVTRWFLVLAPPTIRKTLSNMREFFVKKQQE